MLSNQPKTSGKTTKMGMTSQGLSSQGMTDRPSLKAVNSIGTSGYASKTAGKGSIQTTLKVARQIIKKSQYMQQPPAPKPSMKLSTNIHKSLMFQMKKPNAAESISTRNLQRRNTAIEMQVIPAAKGQINLGKPGESNRRQLLKQRSLSFSLLQSVQKSQGDLDDIECVNTEEAKGVETQPSTKNRAKEKDD